MEKTRKFSQITIVDKLEAKPSNHQAEPWQ